MERNFLDAFRVKIRYIDLIKSIVLLFGCIYFSIVMGYWIWESALLYLFWLTYTIRKIHYEKENDEDYI